MQDALKANFALSEYCVKKTQNKTKTFDFFKLGAKRTGVI